jgi:AAA family ATP:ADP antiporter
MRSPAGPDSVGMRRAYFQRHERTAQAMPAASPLTLSRLFDLRDGEGRSALSGLAALLLVLIAGHTTLETARDALLLTGPGPRALGLVYMAIAGCTLPCAAVAGRAAARFGARRTLGGMIAAAVVLPAVLFFLPVTPTLAIVVYVLSGVIGSVLIPQFWVFVGGELTSSQGRRLFGLIAAAGVVGGVVGSGMAALLLNVLPMTALLALASLVFAVSGVALARVRVSPGTIPLRTRPRRTRAAESLRTFRDYPFLIRVAVMVFLSTATLLALDYFFKSTVARTLPSAMVARFVSRYYLALNGVSLIVQLFVGSQVVRRLGVVGTAMLTPSLVMLGAAGAFAAGGSLLPVLAAKGIDGSLRYSVHRISAELVYLPLPTAVRGRAKPLLDGALGRLAQTVTGAALLALGGTAWLGPRRFAAVVAVLALAWLTAAVALRKPYLTLLRHAISTGTIEPQNNPDPIDLESAELLVQHLASEDANEVVAAMNALSRRGREGLVSALILFHPEPAVCKQALELFSSSARTDWIPLARRILDDPRESLRFAAARALASHGELSPGRLDNDPAFRVRGYSAVHAALGKAGGGDVRLEPRIGEWLQLAGQAGEDVRLGMLAAMADAPPSPRLASLLHSLGESKTGGAESVELFARAAERQGDARVIPSLIRRLSARAGRDAVRRALVTLGEPALEAVSGALADPSLPRRLRIHLPKTLARFATRRAAERLLRSIEIESDGLVRYKSIRALGALVAQSHLPVDRLRVERLVYANVTRHFQVLGLSRALVPVVATGDPPAPVPDRLLLGLLEDKARQALERAFFLLKIAHRQEDIRRVQVASLSDDAYARANAAEFLDALLRRRDQQSLRTLLRIVTDDLPADERLKQAQSHLHQTAVVDRDDALARLLHDADLTVAGLAVLCAQHAASEMLRRVVDQVRRDRPGLVLFDVVADPVGSLAHAG